MSMLVSQHSGKRTATNSKTDEKFDSMQHGQAWTEQPAARSFKITKSNLLLHHPYGSKTQPIESTHTHCP